MLGPLALLLLCSASTACILCATSRTLLPLALPPLQLSRRIRAPSIQPPSMSSEQSEDGETSALKSVMLASIRWYRRELSPLMPPNCRFLPTCSNYALQAIDEFGAVKGGVLTFWRILRCNPIGGFGYDPPQWPPPGFFAGTGRGKNK